MKKYTVILSIAGSDPSGGAGIQADIKAISANGGFATTVITALTAQNTQGVADVFNVPVDFIAQQLETLVADIDIAAIKIGMLSTPDIIDCVANFLTTKPAPHVVLDPVMYAKNGCALLQPEATHYLAERLFPHASLITPNYHEAIALLTSPANTDLDHMAATLAKRYHCHVLIKGGHSQSLYAEDVLYDRAHKTWHRWQRERINTRNTHGTGCTLSASIATFLGRGDDLTTAIGRAKEYIHQALVRGKDYQFGYGHGPVDFFSSDQATE